VYVDKAYIRTLTNNANLKEFNLDDDIDKTAALLGADLDEPKLGVI
jgi:hypothetical protein